ncbi:DUF2975 domain-containing protein [Rathayibacter toxicus]|uniref:DUF2975 domain-containing protein n=1 Tax=Rathayibacter toxicus TaxID=145458 RepID=A0A2S5Y5J1_9MICO|nr:DUF2975 domain-containing protein [Rathayibacter toxicus]PPH21853.1 DUF2975 domain-containing protein [Rathayibacter toxicus]PPH56284.1 DUF2975 domain-containing protein [Rathayibacter toxicus]PPH58380.1 DUF2975 domain-containing protein [Rathayibacter toxicus]PPH86126.1 DUF2975 domain-containing protein [Rathayibacter toxicus]PPI14011.1 DUF2975 domain-containing protein [Rathayibacter toxicus]
MPRHIVIPLRLLIALLALCCVAIQAGVGPVSAKVLQGGPLDTTLVAVIIGGFFCAEAVLISAWRLITFAHNDVLFSGDRRPTLWVDISICALVLGAVLAVVGAITAASILPIPAAIIGFSLIAATSVTLALFVTVMRRLLKIAVAQRSELAAVV